jgi:hypothetical protein
MLVISYFSLYMISGGLVFLTWRGEFPEQSEFEWRKFKIYSQTSPSCQKIGVWCSISAHGLPSLTPTPARMQQVKTWLAAYIATVLRTGKKKFSLCIT